MLWTEEKVTFEGRYYRIEENVCEPKTLQKSDPPIWIGGGSDEILSVVAELFDG